MTFGPSERVTIEGAPRATQPCVTPSDRDGDQPAREGAAVRESPTLDASGRSAREGDPAAGDLVSARDERGLIAAFRVDEQQHDGVRGVVDRRQGFRRRVAAGRT
jgi:hypothetical protein